MLETGCAVPLPNLYCTVLVCTPCWAGVRSGELTLLEIITQTESKYLKQGLSRILALLEIDEMSCICFGYFKM